MKLKNRYFILRHGQTVYQTEKKDFVYPAFPEKPAVRLTKKGEKQIKAAARKLKKEKVAETLSHFPPRPASRSSAIDLIFSSDFFRTKQTASIVANELAKKIIFDKKLRDVNLGIWHGKMKEEFYKNFPRYSKNRFYKRPLGGESWLDCQKRMLNFLKFLEKKYKGKTILIVSHGDPLWLLEGAVKNWSIEKLLKIKKGKAKIIKVGELRKL